MKEVKSEIIIEAAPAEIWKNLTKFEKYPEWNPFIKSVKGNPYEGKKLEVVIQLPKTAPTKFTPKLLCYKENKELRWMSAMFLPGLFDGEHIFLLEEIDTNLTKFIQMRHFRGLLAPFMWRRVRKSSLIGFEAMNNAIKKLSEPKTAGSGAENQ